MLPARPAPARPAPGRPAAVRFGKGIVPLAVGPISLLVSRRALWVSAVLVTLCLLTGLVALTLGDYPLSLAELWHALRREEESMSTTVVWRWRLPRALAALVLGAALGLSGAIFQSLTRNPLGSPDVIGFSAGSHTGALLVIILLGGSYLQVSLGAVLGGLATALVVSLLAYRGGMQGFRLIVVGIGVSAVLGSLNTWMMIQASQEVALTAAVWGAGSLNGIGWEEVIASAAMLAGLLLAAGAASRSMRALELGDDAARALGIRADTARIVLVVIGVAATALVAAAAGPISFIALSAPQIARRLTRSTSVTLGASALTGALLLAVADIAAQHVVGDGSLPVGVMTVSVGGLYLIWLIIREARRAA